MTAAAKELPKVAFAMSDSSANSAETCALAEAELYPAEVKIRIFPEITTVEDVQRVMHDAADCRAVVVYTFADDDLCTAAETLAQSFGVPAVNLFERLRPTYKRWLGVEPAHKPKHHDNGLQLRRMKALLFCTRHEDGQNPAGLEQAEIVLAGLSRTTKTPVSLVLAYKGWLTANVPLVPGVPPSLELLKMPPYRVFVLSMGAKSLSEYRRTRAEQELRAGRVTESYFDPDSIETEIRTVRKLVRANPGWTTIDVNPARHGVEETAARIIHKYEENLAALGNAQN